MMVMFGFAPNPLGSSPQDFCWGDVLCKFENTFPSRRSPAITRLTSTLTDVYNRMVNSLQGSVNIPGSATGGYTDLESGPALICGDASWKWLELDDQDPFDVAGRTLAESQAEKLSVGDVGAWYYKGRYRFLQERTA